MQTKIISANLTDTPALAANFIKQGDLVALPTETVYGLGANGLNPEAVAKIFTAKGRPQDNPLILHIADSAQLEDLCHTIPQAAYQLAERFWPGPLTMVLPAKDCIPKCTTAGLPTVAVRCPDSAITRQIIRLAGVPIAAPSANLSGKPSTTTAQHVFDDHKGNIPLIVDDGPCRVGVESTIVDLTEERPRLLRPGGITPEQLLEVLGDLVVDKAVTAQLGKDEVVKAPGMKYRHYAPQCQVIIVAGSREKAAAYIRLHYAPGDRVLCFAEELPLYDGCAPLAYGKEADAATLSSGLFAALRQLDEPTVKRVFARCPEGGGIAYAVQNRLKKAAGFQIIDAEEFQPPLCKGRYPEGGEGLPIPQSATLTAPFAQGGLVIGITGGTGCGKTTLLDVIREQGGTVLDCDAIYHRLLREDPRLLKAIADRFPGTVENGELQRKKLGAIAFSDPQALEDLNAITHNAVKLEVIRLLESKPRLAAIDAIGLFESGLDKLCKLTVAVTAPTDARIARLMKRDNVDKDYALARIRAQKTCEAYSQLCDYALCNDSTQEAFREKCLAFLAELGIMKAENSKGDFL